MSQDAFRIFLVLAVTMGWDIESTDIKSAFLQGQNLDREVFVEPPLEAKAPGMVWQMLKPLYGLRDAPRRWYLSVAQFLTAVGFEQCKLDPSVFMMSDAESSTLIGLVCVHVDDFLHSGTEYFKVHIIPAIREKFTAGTVESMAFLYIGLELDQTADSVTLSQNEYIQKLKPASVTIARRVDKQAPLDRAECRQFRQIVGQINWAAQQTRPDLLFEVMELSVRFKGPVVQDLLRANKALKKLQSVDVSVCFPRLCTNLSEWHLCVMSDAAFGNLADGVSSGGGHVVFLVGSDRCAAIAWKANKIKRVVRSTMAAEALALEEAMEHAVLLRELIKQMSAGKIAPRIVAWTDNADTAEAVFSTKSVTDKRLRIDIACIKENVEKEKISLFHCKGEKMLADCLTKGTANAEGLLKVLANGSF